MKFAATVLALAASAVAAPSLQQRDDWPCTPGQYFCDQNNTGITVCDIDHSYKYVGDCPAGTVCQTSDVSGQYIPFCTLPPAKDKRDACTPGTYWCNGDFSGIEVCDGQGNVQLNGLCPPNTHCGYPANSVGIPFCLDNAI
ncbi:hypothetical protein NKR23_g11367 [Pleurostoma richardsiae]|uniref:Uncharacterized protein n=1 Tax=Pleurostoma richardsiae TaxID=41990 RepID=A0AA38RHL7_9PEZI|nr:hypothetical protein NKR23_g11367 [Pleurostoma richardsiae]